MTPLDAIPPVAAIQRPSAIAKAPVAAATPVARPQRPAGIAEAFKRLGANTHWTPVKEVKLNFRTFHPQGMVKVGNEYWMSSVEVKGGWLARVLQFLHIKPEQGIGHLFRFNPQGELLGELTLGQGDMFHAGGIDFDGHYLWIPVAAYRPNSESLIYRVDPATMKAEVAFHVPDHIGALAVDGNTLHGASWSAEKLYTWQNGETKVTYHDSRTVDYQDMHHLGDGMVLGSGYHGLKGGIDLVDMNTRMTVHSVPVPLKVGALPVTRNPFFCEQVDGKLQFSFVPSDNKSTLYVYDAQ